MQTKNLPKVVNVKIDRICYECGKKIPKKTNAVFYWWIKRKNAYSHISCVK